MRQFVASRPVIPNLWLGTSVGQRRSLPRLDVLHAIPAAIRFVSLEPLLEDLGVLDLVRIDWGIVGAESDPRGRARLMQLDWVRSIRDQFLAAGTELFFKQNAQRGRKLRCPSSRATSGGSFHQQGKNRNEST
jgi:protein gp37